MDNFTTEHYMNHYLWYLVRSPDVVEDYLALH